MKSSLLKYTAPIGLGLVLFIITFFASSNTGCNLSGSGVTTKNCTNSAYPLWCASVKVCCTPGHAHYCDGQCYSTDCPSGTLMRDNCYPE